MSRRATLVLLVAVLAAACSTSVDEDATPDCALQNGSSVLLLAQAVPTAELIPCVAQLQPGWSLGAFAAGRDAARFSLDSETVGEDFLEVELTAVCPDPTDEVSVVLPGGAAQLEQDAVLTGALDLVVAVVPLDSRHVVFSSLLVTDLQSREITAELVPVGTPHQARIEAALGAGKPVVLIDDFALTDGMVSLYEPDSPEEMVVERRDIVDVLANSLPKESEQSYVGVWRYRFHGGCVTYEFDAGGPDAASLPNLIPVAMSFVSRTTLDRFTRVNVGLELDP